jgi:hypothetical protein
MATYETPYDRMNRKNREEEIRAEYASQTGKNIANTKPGAPYYQPQNEAPDRAEIRAKAQGEYIKNAVGDKYQQDEGILADALRTFKNVQAGKRGNYAMEYGDPALMAGARNAGAEAVKNQSNAEFQRESKGQAEYKKGGKVSSASSRADGIAVKGKTRGTMITMCGGGMYKK